MLKFPRRNYSIKLADFEPHSVRSVINGAKKTKVQKTCDNQRNPMGIQMINKSLYKQIFGSLEKPKFESQVVEQ
jgi:hypothetical protein